MNDKLLIYGSYGYTGNLVVRHALQRGLRPTLAGRSRQKLMAQANELSLPYRVLSLDDRAALDATLSGMTVVAHCAGPYSQTGEPMVAACLRTGTHYLDLTGEILVLDKLARRSTEFQAAGIMVLPGCGFDVVPSDCLAAHLKSQLPSANRLTLVIQALTAISHGTARSVVETIGHATMVRRSGELIRLPAGSLMRTFDVGRGRQTGVAVAWGDVATAYYSTGIPNIEVYFLSSLLGRSIPVARYFTGLLTAAPAQRLLKAAVGLLPRGPSTRQRQRDRGLVWGQVADEQGKVCTALLQVPESYALTMQTLVAAIEKVLAGHVKPGFQTPSMAFGPDFIMELAGVERKDLSSGPVP